MSAFAIFDRAQREREREGWERECDRVSLGRLSPFTTFANIRRYWCTESIRPKLAQTEESIWGCGKFWMDNSNLRIFWSYFPIWPLFWPQMHLISSSLSINDVRAFAIGVGADELGNFERGGILRTSFRHVPFLVRLSSVQTSLMDMPFKSLFKDGASII